MEEPVDMHASTISRPMAFEVCCCGLNRALGGGAEMGWREPARLCKFAFTSAAGREKWEKFMLPWRVPGGDWDEFRLGATGCILGGSMGLDCDADAGNGDVLVAVRLVVAHMPEPLREVVVVCCCGHRVRVEEDCSVRTLLKASTPACGSSPAARPAPSIMAASAVAARLDAVSFPGDAEWGGRIALAAPWLLKDSLRSWVLESGSSPKNSEQ